MGRPRLTFVCAICPEIHYSKGYCKKHYRTKGRQKIVKPQAEPSVFGAAVWRLRSQQNMTMDTLAHLSGIGKNSITYMCKKNSISASLFRHECVAQALGVTLSEMLLPPGYRIVKDVD